MAQGQGSKFGERLALLWSVGGGLLAILGVAVYLWGGTSSAHNRCLAQQFGQSSFIGQLACAAEH